MLLYMYCVFVCVCVCVYACVCTCVYRHKYLCVNVETRGHLLVSSSGAVHTKGTCIFTWTLQTKLGLAGEPKESACLRLSSSGILNTMMLCLSLF